MKQQPSIRAKLNIEESIDSGDADVSKWYLERKNKDEFSTKQQIEADVNNEVTITIELSDD